jgi:hypothetical protein
VQAVRGEFARGDVGADLARRGRLGQQVTDEGVQPLVRLGDVRAAVQRRGVVTVPVPGQPGVGGEPRGEPGRGIAGPVADLDEVGQVSALGTPWGLVRHWWVLIKLALIVVATAVLLLQLAPIAALATGPAQPGSPAGLSLVVHAAGGLVILLAASVLGTFKPRGRTRYGRRHTAPPS